MPKDTETKTTETEPIEQDQAKEQDKPSEAAAAIEAMSPEQLAEAEDMFLSRFYPHAVKEKVKAQAKPEPEKTKEEVEPKPVEAPETETAPAPKAETEKPKTVELPPDISEWSSQRKPIQEQHAVQTQPAPPQEPPKLTEKERKFIATLERMGKDNPSKYGTLASDHAHFATKEKEYIQKWIEDHPGEDYDPRSEEHEDWYKKNEVRYDQDDFESAYEAIVEDRIATKLRSELTDKLSKTEAERALREAQAQINMTTYQSVVDMAILADPAFGKFTKDQNGLKIVTKESQEQYGQQNPAALEIIKEESEPLSHLVQELERFKTSPATYKLDPSTVVHLSETDRDFLVHKELLTTIGEFETEMLKRDPKSTMRDGKRLISNERLNTEMRRIESEKALSRQEKDSIIQQINERYYSLSLEDYRGALISKYASKAKRRLDKISKWVTPAAESKEQESKPTEHVREEKQLKEAVKRTAPSIAGTSDRTDTTAKSVSPSQNDAEVIAGRIFGTLS